MPLRQAVSEQADRALLGRNSSLISKLVCFAAPEKCLAGETGGPYTESQQVAQRVQPAQPQRTAVAHDSPSHHKRQQHAIQPCHEEQLETNMTAKAVIHSEQQRQQAKRNRISETRPDMSQRA